MATSREGNVLHLPGMGSVAEVKGDEILGSYARFTQKGLTLLRKANTVYEAGTLLKVSSTAKKYEGVANAADLSNAIAVLRKAVDVSDEDKPANYVRSGILKLGKLRYANGTVVPSADYAALAEALNGSIDPIHGYLVL